MESPPGTRARLPSIFQCNNISLSLRLCLLLYYGCRTHSLLLSAEIILYAAGCRVLFKATQAWMQKFITLQSMRCHSKDILKLRILKVKLSWQHLWHNVEIHKKNTFWCPSFSFKRVNNRITVGCLQWKRMWPNFKLKQCPFLLILCIVSVLYFINIFECFLYLFVFKVLAKFIFCLFYKFFF